MGNQQSASALSAGNDTPISRERYSSSSSETLPWEQDATLSSSFQDLVKKYGLTDRSYTNKQVSDSDLQLISQSHCKDWWKLPAHLGLESIVVNDIRKSHTGEGEKRHTFFSQWKKIRGHSATYGKLIKALLLINCADDAEYVCSILCKARTNSLTRSGRSFSQHPIKVMPDHAHPSPSSPIFSDSSVRQDLKYQLDNNFKIIQVQYSAFVTCLSDRVKEKNPSVGRLRLNVLSYKAIEQHTLFDEEVKEKLMKANDIHEVFVVISGFHTSFLNYDLFLSIMKSYGIENNCDELNYYEHLKAYLQKHTISEFMTLNPKLERFTAGDDTKVQIKFEIEGIEKLESVVHLHHQVCRLLGATPSSLRIISIEEGCLIITFLIYTHLTKVIMTKFERNRSEFRKLSVLWVKCEGETIISFREAESDDTGTWSTDAGNEETRKGWTIANTIPVKWVEGSLSSVSVQKFGSKVVAVAVLNVSWDYSLYYSVGILDELGKMKWSLRRCYNTGNHPSVSLVCIEDSLYVIEVHKVSDDNMCYYTVGCVNVEEKCIAWSADPVYLGPGKKPKVATTGNGTVMILAESSSEDYNFELYIGSLKLENRKIAWEDGNTTVPNFSGVEPDISINQSKIIIVCRDRDNRMICKVGTHENNVVNWNSCNTLLPTKHTGRHPSISLNSEGTVLNAHQKRFTRELYYCIGKINDADNTIIWTEPMFRDMGEYPSVCLMDNNNFYEIHKTNLGTSLFYKQGTILHI